MFNTSPIGTIDTFQAASLMDGSAHWFDIARNSGYFHKFVSILTFRSYRLVDLESYPIQKRYGHDVGQREVALDEIRGTEGRQNDFDNRFNPLSDRTQQRWMSIARARQTGQELPPVELIKVGDIYFVRDGHHRISVARAFGYKTITARVTVW